VLLLQSCFFLHVLLVISVSSMITFVALLWLQCYAGLNKKSELMLMRRSRAYSSSCSLIILVYLYPSRCNSLFSSQKSPKITKNSYFGGSRSTMLTFLRSSLPVLVTISSMSVLICNRLYARLLCVCY